MILKLFFRREKFKMTDVVDLVSDEGKLSYTCCYIQPDLVLIFCSFSVLNLNILINIDSPVHII